MRAPKWVKEKLEKHGINVAEAVRRGLIEEIERAEMNEIGRQLDASRERLRGRIDPYEFAEIIDEERRHQHR